jgi:hypothetical protein
VTDKAVWKTTHPDALAAYDAQAVAHDEWRERMRNAREQTGVDGWHVWPTTGEVLGPDKSEAGDNVPDGWAAYDKYEHLVPARGRGGAAARELLESVGNEPRSTKLAEAVGVPPLIVAGGMFLRPGFLRGNDALYLVWSRDPGTEWSGDDRFGRCPLSEFYAAKEALETSEVAP